MAQVWQLQKLELNQGIWMKHFSTNNVLKMGQKYFELKFEHSVSGLIKMVVNPFKWKKLNFLEY